MKICQISQVTKLWPIPGFCWQRLRNVCAKVATYQRCFRGSTKDKSYNSQKKRIKYLYFDTQILYCFMLLILAKGTSNVPCSYHYINFLTANSYCKNPYFLESCIGISMENLLKFMFSGATYLGRSPNISMWPIHDKAVTGLAMETDQ